MRKLAAAGTSSAEVARAVHEKLANGLGKGAFALDLLFALPEAGSTDDDPLQCPRYIGEGLDWLVERLLVQDDGADA